MLRRCSILIVLLISLLITGDSFAASHRRSPHLQIYLPQMHQSLACATNAPQERLLVLPSQPLAFISAEDIWLYRVATGNVERTTQNEQSEEAGRSPRLPSLFDRSYNQRGMSEYTSASSTRATRSPKSTRMA